jgi:CO/xanthine dehydrogenase FAD-binding subunit
VTAQTPTRFGYLRCSSLEDVFKAVADHGERARIVAGGTDLVVGLQGRRLDPCMLVDLVRVPELHGIEKADDCLRIGAATTYSQLLESDLVSAHAPLLQQAAVEVGSVQIRNLGTLGGNLANASPAADGVPPLVALGAEVELVSRNGTRRVLCENFATGPGQSVLEAGEIVVAFLVPVCHEHDEGFFSKLGPRDQQAISIVSVTFSGRRVAGTRRYESVRIACGSVAPTVVRAFRAEEALSGIELEPETLFRSSRAILADISPIDDVRGSAEYRRDQAVGLLRSGLEALL